MVTVDMKLSTTNLAGRYLFLALLFLGLALVIVVAVGQSEAEGRTLYVDDDAGEGGNGSLEKPFSRIQEAIGFSENGDTVRVFEGVYEENIALNKTVTLIGNGSANTSLDSGGVGDVVNITADSCNVSGFAIDGNRNGWETSGIQLNSNHNHIFGNSITRNWDSGIYLLDSHFNSIVDNTIRNNSGAGICLKNACTNTLSNNVVHDNEATGILLSSSDSNMITLNDIRNNQYNDGIYLFYSDATRISNNTIKDNANHGISLHYSNSNTIADNNVSNNQCDGISLSDSESCILSGNRMTGNSILIKGGYLENWNTHWIERDNTVNGKQVFFLKNASGVTVPTGAGEVILAGCTDILVENQDLSGGSCGILVGYSLRTSIINNVIRNNTHYGIYATTYTHRMIYDPSEISNNTIHDNGYYGIFVKGGTYEPYLISNNTILNHRQGGIFLWYSDRNTVSNNTILNSSRQAIGLKASGSNTIANNTIQENENGIYLERADGNSIANNRISGNRVGICLEEDMDYGSGGNTAHDNFIFSNSEFGIDAAGNDGDSINAINNWWGDESGPYHPESNPGGRGDNITDYVEFGPWLREPIMGGFQGKGPDNEKPDDESKNEDSDHGLILHPGAAVLIVLLAVAPILFFHLSEPFRFALLRLFTPLYTRLNQNKIESDIAQQNIRGRIYQYIKDQPGINLSSIKAELRIGYGTVVHHLAVLERERYLRSATEGRKKRFWVKRDFPGLEALGTTDTQRQILEALEKFGPLSRNQLRERTGLVRTTLNSNVKRLLEAGKLEETEGSGNEKLCSVKLY